MVTNDESDYLPDIYMTDIMNQQYDQHWIDENTNAWPSD